MDGWIKASRVSVCAPWVRLQTDGREGWVPHSNNHHSSIYTPTYHQAIARQCGILTQRGLVLEGPAFRNMTPRQLDEALPRLQAR